MCTINENNKFKRGITLVEVLVSISIVLIMTTAIVINFSDIKKETSLLLFQDQLIAHLRYVQVRSMNSSNTLGIHIGSSNHFILFEDMNLDNSLDSEEERERVNIPEGITFASPLIGSNLLFDNDGSPVFFDKNGTSLYPVLLIIEDIANNSKIILINRVGLIKSQN